MEALWLIAGAVVAAILAAGCGSRAHSPVAGSNSARAAFAIKWPDRSRLIPAASNSLKIEIRKGDALLAGKVIDRPADGGTATVTFENLPVGDLTATATAYPQAGAIGTPQAEGTMTITARDGETVNSILNLASTIDRLEITPASRIVALGGTLQLTATARNAAGEVVLVAAGDLRWTSSDATKASVDAASGLVTGLALGSAVITVTESESGKAQSAPVGVGSGLAQSAWPKFGGDAGNTGRGQGSGATGKVTWYHGMGKVDASVAIGADGTVYVSCNGWYPGLSKMYAYDGATGARKWEFATAFGGSEPAIGADGTLYFGADKVYALDGATGTKKWEFATSGIAFGWSAAAIGADGTVYIGADTLYALDGATGAQKWRFSAVGAVRGCPAIGTDGTVYVGASDYRMYAVDGATGAKKWEFATGGAVGSAAIGSDGTLYFGSGDARVYAVDGATGARKWEYATDYGVSSSPALGADGTVYVHADSMLYALDGATGTRKWSVGMGGSASPTIAADGTVYTAGSSLLYALDGATGAQKWAFSTQGLYLGNSIATAPAIGADGTLYITTYFGGVPSAYVIAIR